MYSPNPPVLSTINDHQLSTGGFLSPTLHTRSQCLKFKYFTTFLICTTCLALLSASLATHKWIVSKPIRILRLNGAQTNFTALMLTADQLEQPIDDRNHQHNPSSSLLSSLTSQQQQQAPLLTSDLLSGSSISGQNNKFQGEIYFGLFSGVKVLNYGFGDRVSQLSVGVALAILFALIGSIFAIINFVMAPRGTLTGPVGLVIWNAAACFSCLLAMVSWLVEYFLRLKTNVLTSEEVQNGWTSENRSQFGYSYYFVVLAFILHLVNIFVVSIVQFETWTNNKAAKRQSRAACEGVIMLY